MDTVSSAELLRRVMSAGDDTTIPERTLSVLVREGLVTRTGNTICVTEKGRDALNNAR